jgi:membrane AbrB-like protein
MLPPDEIAPKTDDAAPASTGWAGFVPVVRISVALTATFAIGLAGGHVAKLLHFPLPYMTGALLTTAALGLAGVPVRSVWQARAAGQFVTGTAIGTSFTPALLLTILTLLPMLVLGAVISVVIGAAGALILMRLVKVDSRTAFLAAMPGGVIEMANVAARVGADPLPIMVLQTMRVGLSVTVAPFLATILAEHGTAQEIARAEVMSDVMSWLTIAGLMAASFVGGFALWLIRLPNCWFLGSIITVAIIGALGLVAGRVPDVILVVAQVIIGVSIGTQYRHEFLTRLLRLLLSSLVTVPFALAATGLVAVLYALLLTLPVPTMFLALAPAGIAEMALTGKVLGLDAALITGFQVVRILMVTLGAAAACRLFERLVGH